jgi:hypothetical protein
MPVERLDLVGNGYRCARCTALVEQLGEEASVVDNETPEHRERMAKQGKRRFFASVAGSGAMLGGPAAVGFAVGGPIGAALGGLLGLYVAGALVSSAGEVSWRQWRRYRTPPLPKAKLRK